MRQKNDTLSTASDSDLTALRASEEKYSCLFHQSSNAILIHDAAGTIVDLNQRVLDLTFRSREDLLGTAAAELLIEKDRAAASQSARLLARGDFSEFDAQVLQGNDTDLPVRVSASAVEVAGNILVQWSMRDARDRNRLELQLRQSQRMEAVGRLAGGIAHDFNNLLTVIAMYCDLLLSQLDSEATHFTDVEQIKKAGERAATLTRQLLAFSRQQILRPQVLDLNSVVSDLGSMLRRLIREDIELHTELANDLGAIEADRGQLEQVLMNLVVNARDAMPSGGQLRVETSNLQLTRNSTGYDPLLPPGHYVLLAVSDTGAGIAREALPRIFEPFYTTKERGKGTGLGLSTVYGIVKQSGGFIFADTTDSRAGNRGANNRDASGRGACFRVYLPQVFRQPEPSEPKAVETGLSRGSETVLVVEDEVALRALVAKVLRSHGYRVLEAEDGPAALGILAAYDGEVHLMVTDLVMPGMSGRELTTQVRGTAGAMKVLFMSGYNTEAIALHGLLEPETRFLEKPFTTEALARKVRGLLNEEFSRD